MTQYDETQIGSLVLKQTDQQRSSVGKVRYDPWGLTLSTSFALSLYVAAIGLAYEFVSVWLAVGAGVVLVPIPIGVSWWCWRAFAVERQRLAKEPELFNAPALPEPAGSDEPEPQTTGEPVQLRPGLLANGQLVAPVVEIDPRVAALRRKCLTLAHAGMRAGSWSRSKVAEGPNRMMKGTDWDDASRELQRLGYFDTESGSLAPAVGKDLGDLIKRLELAR